MEYTKQDDMRQEFKRLASFQQYPMPTPRGGDHASLLVYNSPLKLAKAGFYRQAGAVVDEVICFACFVTYRNWQGESPFAVHRIISSDCPYLTSCRTPVREPPPSSAGTSGPGNQIRRRLFPATDDDGNNSDAESENDDQPQSLIDLVDNVSVPFRLAVGEDDMFFESCRLQTFVDVNPADPLALEWSACGFIYHQDGVMCVFCGVKTCFDSQHPLQVHERLSPNCAIVKYIDVGNIPKDLENRVRIQQLEQAKDQSSRRGSFPFLHPQYEENSVRNKTFQYWPCQLEQTAKQLCEAGFYFTGCSDKVVCFCCGCSLRNWRLGADPWIQHALQSPDCIYLKQKRNEEFISKALQNEILTDCDPAQEAPVTSNGSMHAADPRKASLDMDAIIGALSCGYYPNKSLLIATLQAGDTSFSMLQRLRGTVHHKDGVIQQKDGVIQRQGCQIQQETTVLQGQAAVIQKKNQQLQSKDDQIQQLQRQLQEFQIQSHRELQIQSREFQIQSREFQIQSQELQRLRNTQRQQEINHFPEDQEPDSPPSFTRCTVCLGEEAQALFRPCRHICCGTQCAPHFVGRNCPMCRREVQEWELVFIA